jgi:hypothetical protein
MDAPQKILAIHGLLRQSEWNLKNPVLEGKRVRRKRQGGMGVPPVLTLISFSNGGTIFCGGMSGCLNLPRGVRMHPHFFLFVWIGEIRGLTNFSSTDCG